MRRTSIEWTDFSANPLKYKRANGQSVWACVKTSPGCAHCYAEGIAARYERGGEFVPAQMAGLTPYLDPADLHKLLSAKTVDGHLVRGGKCFLGDMTDLFGEWVPDALLDELFAVMALRSDVTWQILTKRAERMRAYFADENTVERIEEHLWARHTDTTTNAMPLGPLPNVWLGVSVENQHFADERIPLLLQTPAAVRFISAEPLLGPVDLSPWLGNTVGLEASLAPGRGLRVDAFTVKRGGLDWVIVGGESGDHSRPFDLAWARSIAAQCQAARVPVFVKQLGSMPCAQSTANPDHALVTLKSKKGGDPNEWPEDLRIRQFPAVPA